jgi:hypothetical protein
VQQRRTRHVPPEQQGTDWPATPRSPPAATPRLAPRRYGTGCPARRRPPPVRAPG